MVELTINGEAHKVDVDPNMPLLWVLRDELQLTGTKYGCGAGLCGSCMVHVEGDPLYSCLTPVSAVAGKHITTIEGLDSDAGRAVQAAWNKLDVVQCGYCQSGQIMAATALLARNRAPSEAEIEQTMAANLCRCVTYVRIRDAIAEAARALA